MRPGDFRRRRRRPLEFGPTRPVGPQQPAANRISSLRRRPGGPSRP